VNKIALPVTASPSSLDFGDVWSGDSRHKVVSVGVGADGNVSAGIPPGKVFKITKMEVFGTPQTSPVSVMQKQSVSQGQKVQLGKGEVITQGGGTEQKPQANPQGGQQMIFTQKLLASTSSLPFTLPAKQGDSVRITVDFTPDPNIFTGTAVGKHDSSLGVSGPMWKADVPLAAMYNGVKVGVIATIESRDVDLIIPETYVPDQTKPVPLTLTLINSDKQAQDVKISASNLPKWMKFNTNTRRVPAGETLKVPLSLQFDKYTDLPYGKPIIEVPGEFTVEYGGVSKKVSFNLRVIRGYYIWDFRNGGSWSASMRIRSDGETTFTFHCPKKPINVLHKCWCDFYYGGQKLANLIVTGDRESATLTTKLPYVAEQYTNMLMGTPSVKAPDWDKDSDLTNGVPLN
jgi:hypothetical protein